MMVGAVNIFNTKSAQSKTKNKQTQTQTHKKKQKKNKMQDSIDTDYSSSFDSYSSSSYSSSYDDDDDESDEEMEELFETPNRFISLNALLREYKGFYDNRLSAYNAIDIAQVKDASKITRIDVFGM